MSVESDENQNKLNILPESTRLEKDTMGAIEIETSRYWGAQTERSRRNFKRGTERIPLELIYAFAYLKHTAAEVNGDLRLLKPEWVDAIQTAANEIIDGKFDTHFPLVVWQTGSGTQTNMNLNEVIARRSNELLGLEHVIHPNDHVNMGQSSNDSFPTAMHIAAALSIHNRLLPALNHAHKILVDKATDFSNIIKVGRTHLQDATPITLGQEFSAYAAQIRSNLDRIKSTVAGIYSLAQGGTAVGTGLNCPKGF